MSVDEGLYAWVQEALEPVGTVTRRPMMGVAALYLDGIIFAILGDELWLKGDADSDAAWHAAGCDRFSFESQGRTVSTSYRRAPAEVHDDADAMRAWAAVAVAAGLRAAARKKPKRAKSRS